MAANFWYFNLELNACVTYLACHRPICAQALGPIGAQNRCRQFRDSKVRYKFIFYVLDVVLRIPYFSA